MLKCSRGSSTGTASAKIDFNLSSPEEIHLLLSDCNQYYHKLEEDRRHFLVLFEHGSQSDLAPDSIKKHALVYTQR